MNIVIFMNTNNLLIGILTFTVGVLILLASDAFIKFAVIILGAAAIISGIMNLLSARNQILDPVYNKAVCIRGILSLIVGLVAVTSPLYLAKTVFNTITYILAVYFLISACLQIFTAARLHRNGVSVKNSVIQILTSLMISAFLFMMNFNTFKIIIYAIGILLIIAGLSIFFFQWKSHPLIISPDSVETVPDETPESESDKK